MFPFTNKLFFFFLNKYSFLTLVIAKLALLRWMAPYPCMAWEEGKGRSGNRRGIEGELGLDVIKINCTYA